MARNENFWMPLYWDDLMTDGRVEGLDDRQFKSLFLLLWKAWCQERPVGTLPDDDVVLARWARRSLKEWRAMREEVLCRNFVLREDARWHLDWMEERHKEVMEKRGKASDHGRLMARRRWGIRKNKEPDAGSNAAALLTECSCNASDDAAAVLGVCCGNTSQSQSNCTNNKGGGATAETVAVSNTPSLERAWDYVQKSGMHGPDGVPYSLEDVRGAWLSLEAGKDRLTGFWMWGKSPKMDWRAVLESRLYDRREMRMKNPASAEPRGGTRPTETVFGKKTRLEQLKRVRDGHVCNRQSTAFEEEASAEARDEWKQVRREIEGLERELAGL